MRGTSTTLSLAVSLIATAGLWQAAARQTDDTGPADLQPQLEVVLRGGFKGNDIRMGLGLDRETWIETTLYTGSREVPEKGMCLGGGMAAMAGGSGIPADAAPLVAWTLSARLIDVDGDSATVDIRWRRQPGASYLEPSAVHEGRVRWKLREGTPMVLDTVRSLGAGDPACLSAALSAEFTLAGAMAFNNAAIAYDAWLVQQLPSGQRRTHHMRTTGRQGERVSFMFPLVTLNESPAASNSVMPVDLAVSGGVRGRLRTDGSVDLSVDASRFVMLRDASQGTGSTGRTHLKTRSGETVEFEPVPLGGMIAGVPMASVLGDARTAIRIRASRAW